MEPHESESDDATNRAWETRLARQPWRTPPAEWRSAILPTPSRSVRERAGIGEWLRRWLVPSPLVGGAFVVAWMLIAGFQLAAEWSAQRSPTFARQEGIHSSGSLAGWREQRALLSALLDEPRAPEPQPANLLRPRSELRLPRFGFETRSVRSDASV